jgi:hypothetical protein
MSTNDRHRNKQKDNKNKEAGVSIFNFMEEAITYRTNRASTIRHLGLLTRPASPSRSWRMARAVFLSSLNIVKQKSLASKPRR